MTKKDIANAVAAKTGTPAVQAKEIVQKTMDAIVTALISERRIELRGFGVFEVKKRAARNARNPRTGEKVFVAERLVVTFQPGSNMIERLSGLDAGPAETSNAA